MLRSESNRTEAGENKWVKLREDSYLNSKRINLWTLPLCYILVLDEIYDNVASQFSNFTSGTPDDLFEMNRIMIQPRRISKAINEIVSKVMIALRQLEYVVELIGMQSRVSEVESS